ncbi:DUF4381 domain-containing protein [Eionea flava]
MPPLILHKRHISRLITKTLLTALWLVPASVIANPLPLADIHTPEHVSAWPPAIGWWLLLALLITLLIATIIGVKRYQKKWGYRRAALALLNTHYQQWQKATQTSQENNEDINHTCATALNEILKRTVRTAYGSDKAALYGDAWVSFLNQQTQKDYIQGDIAVWIKEQQYRPQPTTTADNHTINIPDFYKACACWVKHHNSSTPLAKGEG